jgi:putative heme-binding domain-containing protein
VLLDGFGNHANAHNLANAFAWGPDGWLYGTHGRTNWSVLGKPGTPDSERVRFDGGVWRYHPVRHVWESFADGTTNPWGIDWDDFGEGFVCNCVDPHLFHVIQGAHYEPWRDRESSEFAYERIASIADHLHFIGKGAVRDGLGTPEEDAAGGGHAHCGTMVYLGDNWPEQYRDTVFMHNIHGHRINNDVLRRSGSGYTASHGRDLMRAKDPWYMGVTLRYGSDGAVYSSDWSDTGECHSRTNTRRQTGRIYKITYGNRPAVKVDVAKLGDAELVELQLHRNDWYVQHARRVLQERAASGHDLSAARRALQKMFAEQSDVTRQLRALWALHVTGGIEDDFLIQQLEHPSEYIRSWCIRLLCEDGDPPRGALERFQEIAAQGNSPFDRLHLASALQRLAPEVRWNIAAALVARADDAADPNLPLMYWYAIEPLVHEDVGRFAALALRTRLRVVGRNIGRRAASLGDPADALLVLVSHLGEARDVARHDLLAGILLGLEGRRTVRMPVNWPMVYALLQRSRSVDVRESSLRLALIFDDPVALEAIRREARDKTAAAAARNRSVQALVAKGIADLAPLLLELVGDPVTRSAALRGLAEYNHPATLSTILNGYASFDPAARQDALQTLASRPAWAMGLLDAVESKRIPRSDLTAYTARQMLSLGNERISKRVQALWGEVRETPAEKAKIVARYKERLTPEVLSRSDRSAGRAVFQKTCANCHTLFDAGGNVGPNITGSQRTNLDYLLQTLVDPSAFVARDYQMQVIETTGGRVITGLVVSGSKTAVTIQTVNEKVVVPVEEIETRSVSKVSMMPDGMLQNLSAEELRNLIAYLVGTTQVPLTEPKQK